MKIVVATHNKNKVIEFKRIFQQFDLDVLSQDQAGINVNPIEDGKTFYDNARIKALSVSRETECIAIADDSGMCIDAFDGAPGVYSARYLGEDTPYNIKNDIILDKLKDVPDEKRTAKYVCAICCILPDGKEISAIGECQGIIGKEQKGNNGFGYDPIFVVDGKSMAEMSSAEKDSISHRGRALNDFLVKFKEYISECDFKVD